MDLKEAIALSVQRALNEFDQFDDLRESYLEDEKALNLSISITIPDGGDVVECKITGAIKCQSEAFVRLSDQMEMNFCMEDVATDIERGSRHD